MMAARTVADGSRWVVDDYRITRFHLPLDRRIGAAQMSSDWIDLCALEVVTRDGSVGLGFFTSLVLPLPPLAELERIFALQSLPELVGRSPAELLNTISRPRGRNIQSNAFTVAIDTALWDLLGKRLELPLYRLLGGSSPRVRCYASGLDFPLSNVEAAAFFVRACSQGFSAVKVKVGRPDAKDDTDRLLAIRDAVGPDVVMMVDANEEWSARETLRRLHSFAAAGIDVAWVEDPCLRFDIEAMKCIRSAALTTRLAVGEYLTAREIVGAMNAGALDVVNLAGSISDSLYCARIAADHGLPVALGNSPLDIGVHVAAALPDVMWVEHSFLGWGILVDQPIAVTDGHAIAPDRPGHGLTLSRETSALYVQDQGQ